MRQLDRDQLSAFLSSAKSRAFHLETRDEYKSESEDQAVQDFLAGKTTDPYGPWFQSWERFVADLTGRGVTMQRVRIITVPHTRYIDYEHALSPYNLAAGEDVRWLPRDQADPDDSLADDFWLVDDHAVSYSLFDSSNWFIGGAVTTDPAIVGCARAIRDRVWERAIPHDQYRT